MTSPRSLESGILSPTTRGRCVHCSRPSGCRCAGASTHHRRFGSDAVPVFGLLDGPSFGLVGARRSFA